MFSMAETSSKSNVYLENMRVIEESYMRYGGNKKKKRKRRWVSETELGMRVDLVSFIYLNVSSLSTFTSLSWCLAGGRRWGKHALNCDIL